MTIRTLTRLLAAAAFGAAASSALAEDIDIFSQNTSVPTGAPNVLIVLDNTANWSQSFDSSTKFAAEKVALAQIINNLIAKALPINIGLMLFTETGSPNTNTDGGYVRFAIQPIIDQNGQPTNAANCLLTMMGGTPTTPCSGANTTYYTSLSNDCSSTTAPCDKSNGGKIGVTMAEAYEYYAGINAYAGNNKVKADPTAFTSGTIAGPQYLSPIATGTCAKNFIIVINNGPFQDNQSVSGGTATAVSLLTAAGGDTTIINPPDNGTSNNNEADEWTRFLNRVSTVQAITYTLEVGPQTNTQGTYNTALLQSMGTQGAGGYLSASSAIDLGNDLTRIFNDIQAVNSVFASSSLPLSADNTGNFSNQVYIGVFRPDGGGQPRWVGNLKEYQFAIDSNKNLYVADALGAPAASATSGFSTPSAQSFWTSKDTTKAPDATFAAATSTANGSTGGFWYFDSKGAGGSYDLPDGEWVEKGGAAEQLRLAYLGYGGRGAIGDQNNSTQTNSKPNRMVYTCTGTCLTTSGSTLSSFPFDASNSAVTADPTTFKINPVAVTVTNISSDRSVATITAGTSLPSVSSLVVAGTTATVTTSKKHNLSVGNSVTITGSSIAGTNNTFVVTATPKNTTFTYTVPAATTQGTASGTITATLVGSIATVNFASVPHGFSTGTKVVISGASCKSATSGDPTLDPCSGFNGSFTVASVPNSIQFTVPLASSVGATANTGSILASSTIARATTSSAHGYSVGDSVTIANADCSSNTVPSVCSAYNTTATITLIPTTTTFDYVYTGTTPLAQASNSGITAADNTPGTSTLATLIKWVRGQDTQNENNFQVAGANTDVRASIHGDVLHSKPVVLNYAATGATSDDIYLFYGGNDGVFRAVKGGQASTDGVEKWAFIPQEFFPILKRQSDNSPLVLYPSTPSGLGATHRDYAWDGPVVSYITRDSSGNLTKALLFISVRRGGRFIYALDVTDHDNPKFLWRKGCYTSSGTTTCDSGYSEIGETWSMPTVALVQATEAGGDPVLIFGGGYDATSEDAEPPATSDTMGRAVYFVDALNGSVIWSVGTSANNAQGTASDVTKQDSRLVFAFTADILAIDRHQTGFIDRVYAADIGGNVWRIDTSGTSTSGWSIHNLAEVGGRTPGPTTPGQATTAGRKFMFGPDLVVTETGTFDAIVIGSGDREHPLATSADAASVSNRAYMFVDPNVNTTGTDQDITENDLAAVDTTTTTPVDLTGKKGWYVPLRDGEKVVNGPIVVASSMIFGTNQPCSSGKLTDSGDCDTSGNSTTLTCTGNLGIARRYDINFLTGAPASPGFTDASGTAVRSELVAGGGLLPSPVAGEVNINGTPYTFITDNPLSPGGVLTPTINVSNTRFRTYWHAVIE